jgi:hypothetical protein
MKGRLVILLLALVPAAVFGADGETDLFDGAEKLFRERKYDLAWKGTTPSCGTTRFGARGGRPVPARRLLYFLGRYRESADLFRRIELRHRSTRFLRSVPFWKVSRPSA